MERDAKGRFLPRGDAPAAKRAATTKPKRIGKAKGRAAPWSQRRERMFLATLAETSNIAASLRASGLAETTVRRRKAKDAAFDAAWGAALREGYGRLETMVLERALAGTDKPVFHAGKQVGSVRQYNDRLALALLTLHRGAVRGRPMRDEEPVLPALSLEERRAALEERLSEMNRRMGGAG